MNIPGYIIRRRLGAGGQAIVYLATQQSLERQVALKVMHPHFATSSEFTARFLNEGRILANLDHANVVTIHDIGVAGDLHYLAMELVDGGDLTRRIHTGLDAHTALNYLATIAGCLAAVHARHIVHRDIKPCNVLFRRDGTLLLTDFGIAKKLWPGSDLTLSGIGLGSPHYLSPEQARGLPVDGRTDIYSLGAMAYEMLAGERPFRAHSEIDTIFQHVHAPVPRLPVHLARYQQLIDCTMAKSPDDRFASAEELARYLRGLRETPPPKTAIFCSPSRRAVTAFGLPVRPLAPVRREALTDFHALMPLAAQTAQVPARRRPGALLVATLLGSVALALWTRETTDPVATVPAAPAATGTVGGGSDAADERLRKLMARAEKALANLRLTRPRGDNAVYYYQQALAVDSTNTASREGLDRVAARYVALAARALEQYELDRAGVLIGRGLTIDADNVDLRTLQAKLRRFEAMAVAEAPPQTQPRSAAPPPQIEGESPAELLNRIHGWFR